MFSFASRGKREVSIIYDVSAESVGAAVILSAKGKIPHVIYACREYFFTNALADGNARRLIGIMTKTLERLDEHIRRRILRNDFFESYPRGKVYFSFSSPWVEVKPKNLTAEKFLLKLSSDFGVSKDAFVVVENNVGLPKEIHDSVSSLYSSHKALSFDNAVSQVFGASRPSAKDAVKRILGPKVSAGNSVYLDPALLIIAAHVGGGLSDK